MSSIVDGTKRVLSLGTLVCLLGSQAAIAGPNPGPDALEARRALRDSEGERNLVLNSMELGLAALRLARNDEARSAFDEAIERIESVYSNTESAAAARSLWHEEGAKDFKGEPYERTMVYFYRGLIYILDGELDNARACFRRGLWHDSMAEEEQDRADFVTLAFLDGLLSERLGRPDLAEEAYSYVAGIQPGFRRPRSDTAVLLVVESGTSPRKVADGKGHAELKYRRGRNFDEQEVRLRVSSPAGDAPFVAEDLFYQASTRGGRPVDRILEGKVQFVEKQERTSASVADVAGAAEASAMYAGAVGSGGNALTMMRVSYGLNLVAGIGMLRAAKARPHADVRYWSNLPDRLFLWPLGPSDPRSVVVEFLGQDRRVLDGLSRNLELPDCQQSLCVVFVPTPHANEMPSVRPRTLGSSTERRKR